jgi:hypothetical protein
MGHARIDTRWRLLAMSAAIAACLTATGCVGLPGVEADLDATLTNDSSSTVLVYRFDSGGKISRERRAAPGETVMVTLGGNCETGWEVRRGGEAAEQLGEICPDDELRVTDDGVSGDG